MATLADRRSNLFFMPLVTVKQPDGTYAKITLEEFVRRQKNASASASAVQTAPVSAPPSIPRAEPPVVAPVKPAPPAPVAPPRKEPVRAVNDTPSVKDARAFIADFSTGIPPAPAVQGMGVTSEQDVARIVSRLSFSVPEEYRDRLNHAVELRLKELRTDDQTKDLVRRSYEEGGLQLSAENIEELLSLSAAREQIMVMPAQKVATTAPFNSFKHDPTPAPVTSIKQVMPAEPAPVMPSRSMPEPLFGERPKPRPMVTDVTYKPMAIGPVEEIRTITLTDFRRLSPVPRDAALRLEQKFTNLKGESIVLFLEALDAWRQSPLYQEYTDRMLYAILHRSSLDTVLRKTKSITSDELAALIAMEKRLAY